MKILVVGYGVVGSVLCKLLAKEKKVSSITCLDLHHMHHLGIQKIHFKKLNVSNKKEFLKLLDNEHFDVVVNTSLPIFNKILMNYCLEKKVNYMDLASYWDHDKKSTAKSPYKVEQLDFNNDFKKKKLVGLINAGVSPGLSNLLARQCSDNLDKIENIKIRLFEDTKTEELYFPWSVEWLLDEMKWKPLVYRDKKFRMMENFSEEEVYRFPEPLGERKVYLISQEEIGTIPLFIKTDNIDIKGYDNQINVAKLLIKTGLVSEEEIKIGNVKIKPFKILSELLKKKINEGKKIKIPGNAQFGLVVHVEGKKESKKLDVNVSVVFPNQGSINRLNLDANFISYPTALMAKLFILSLPKIKNYGVYPPENLEENARKNILKQLARFCSIKRRIFK